MTDARSERIVHGGMTKGTLNSNRAEPTLAVEVPGQSHHGIRFQEQQRCRRIVEVDLAFPESGYDAGGQRVHVDFQAYRERRRRAHPRPHAAQLLPFDCFVKSQRVTPEALVAECGEPKGLLALVGHLFGIVTNHGTEP